MTTAPTSRTTTITGPLLALVALATGCSRGTDTGSPTTTAAPSSSAAPVTSPPHRFAAAYPVSCSRGGPCPSGSYCSHSSCITIGGTLVSTVHVRGDTANEYCNGLSGALTVPPCPDAPDAGAGSVCNLAAVFDPGINNEGNLSTYTLDPTTPPLGGCQVSTYTTSAHVARRGCRGRAVPSVDRFR